MSTTVDEGLLTRARSVRGRSVTQKTALNRDALESVSIGALVERLGRPSDDRMRPVCAALDVAVDCG